jgi:UDP-glucose 4-epimerase
MVEKRLDIHRIDMLEEKLLREVLIDNRRDTLGVVHLAAVSRVATCERNTTRCLAVNMRATELLTSLLADVHPQHYAAPFLVFTSSREVFGDTRDTVVDEDSVQSPLNVYGTSKAFAETHVVRLADKGYRCVILRLSNVFGSWEVSCVLFML